MRKLTLLPILLVMLLLSSCTGNIPGVSDVIEEPTGQDFNTLDQYLSYEIMTTSGEKLSAAIKATVEVDGADKKIETEAYNKARPQDRTVFTDFKNSFPETEWVKCTIQVMPWNGSDFSKGDAKLTGFVGYNDDPYPIGEKNFCTNWFVIDSLSSGITEYQSYEYDSGDSAVMYATMFNIVNSFEGTYYEYVAYVILPIERKDYVFGLTSKDIRPFSGEEAPDKYPAEGYLCWKIPEEKMEG